VPELVWAFAAGVTAAAEQAAGRLDGDRCFASGATLSLNLGV